MQMTTRMSLIVECGALHQCSASVLLRNAGPDMAIARHVRREVGRLHRWFSFPNLLHAGMGIATLRLSTRLKLLIVLILITD